MILKSTAMFVHAGVCFHHCDCDVASSLNNNYDTRSGREQCKKHTYMPLMKTDECLSSTARLKFHLDILELPSIWITARVVLQQLGH